MVTWVCSLLILLNVLFLYLQICALAAQSFTSIGLRGCPPFSSHNVNRRLSTKILQLPLHSCLIKYLRFYKSYKLSFFFFPAVNLIPLFLVFLVLVHVFSLISLINGPSMPIFLYIHTISSLLGLIISHFFLLS